MTITLEDSGTAPGFANNPTASTLSYRAPTRTFYAELPGPQLNIVTVSWDSPPGVDTLRATIDSTLIIVPDSEQPEGQRRPRTRTG